jgi:predicted Zn-ribbon and HTH transcriptional regulator
MIVINKGTMMKNIHNDPPIDERAINRKSDELQMGIMNCIKCGRAYKGNIISAFCPDCKDNNHHPYPCEDCSGIK